MDDYSTSTNFSTNKNTVLLMTASTEITKSLPNHLEKTNAHLLFASGSQGRYISKTFWEKLKLPTIRTENLKIQVFGNDRFKPEKVDIVLFILDENEKLVTIEAICYPVICSGLN